MLDGVDRRILSELQADGRLSYNELARRVGRSTPAVAERVRRLSERGVIAGYHPRVDPSAAALPVPALVGMESFGPRCLLRDDAAMARTQILQLHRVTGETCRV